MSATAILYLVGMGLLFVGERLLAAYGAIRWVVDATGLAVIAAGVVWRGREIKAADDAGIEEGHRTALTLMAVGAGSLLIYLLSTDAAVRMLGFGDTAADRWTTTWSALWPIVWLCGTLPLLVVDHALNNSPIVAPPRRIREALNHGLAAALGLALVFPVNYLASQHDTRWDLTYFKTAQAGSATRAVVDSFERPVHVYAFLPPTAEINSDIDGYFEPLTGSKLTYRRLDQAAHPTLARKLQVRDNGTIAFTTRALTDTATGDEDDDPPPVETFEIGLTRDEAEETLETLDEEVQQKMIAASRGQRVAYLTTSHGEFETARSAPRQRRIQVFERVLETAGFRVSEIGLDDGLSDGAPEDADLIVAIGPSNDFMEAEIEALRQYLDGGGSLFAAVEPAYSRGGDTVDRTAPPLTELTDKLGVAFGDGLLASDQSILPVTQSRRDRLNLVTEQFSKHPSTATVAGSGQVLFTPTTGFLEIPEDAGADVTVTVDSPSDAWVDKNGNLTFDEQSGESKGKRPVVAASTRQSPGESRPWRALVSADASLFTDHAMGNRANRQFAFDSVQWLVGTEAFAGRVSGEEDVRIQHTKEGQTVWFYGTVVGFPLLLLAAGGFRIWRRRKGGDA